MRGVINDKEKGTKDKKDQKRLLSNKTKDKIREQVEVMMPTRQKRGQYNDIKQALQNTGVGIHQDLRVAQARLDNVEVTKKAKEILKTK